MMEQGLFFIYQEMIIMVEIYKFGGACFKTPQTMQQTINIILDDPKPLVVVVSAFFGVTDLLHQILDLKSKDILKGKLIELKNQIESVLVSPLKEKERHEFEEYLQKLESLLLGKIYAGLLTARVKDTILSFGEKISAFLLASMLQYYEHDVLLVDPKTFLITDGNFYEASVDLPQSEKLAQKTLTPYINEHQIILVPGYYGANEKGEITLLGRSGTDYSAACIANILQAKSLTIWKDVPGFMSADPKIVPNAKRLSSMDYETAALLTFYGAKLIHPKALEPLKSKNIPLIIRDFQNLSSKTTILPVSIGTGPVISFMEGLVEVSCSYPETNASLEKLGDIVSSFQFPIYYSGIIGSKLILVISHQHLKYLPLDEYLEVNPISAVLLLGSPMVDMNSSYVSAIKGNGNILFLCRPNEMLNLIMELHNIPENKNKN